MVNNIPVNGWPQLKDLEAVQPTLDRLDKIEAWKRTVKEETFTGDDITIENALALPARSLITEINAIQDLHGYDHPWAGGAGKNKLAYPYVESSKTVNGLTITVNNDGTVIINGTATANTNLVLADKASLDRLPSGNYIMNGCPAGGATDGSTYYVGFYAPNKSAYDFGNGTSISLSGNEDASANIYIRIANGYTANNLVFKPMIRLASESDPTFAPYSNICPISGRDSVVITRSDGDEISEDFTIQLGQTVYGGSVDFTTGVATLTHVLLTKNTADMNNGESYPGWSNSGIKAIVGPNHNQQYTNQMLNIGTVYSANTYDNMDTLFLPRAIYGKTETEWKALAMDIQIRAELATPQTIQLTPEQLELLKGYNRVTLSDGYGTIEIKALTGANWS